MPLEDDIKQAENATKAGWNQHKQLWFPHNSIEGGTRTIAYGHKCTVAEQAEWEASGLTDSAANQLFLTDMATARADVTALLTSHSIESLRSGAMAALTEMAFNLGRTKLDGFVKMWAALGQKPADYTEAANQMKASKWYTDVKATRGDRMIKSMKE